MMMINEFPERYGFRYNDNYDEWQKPLFNGIIILWEKPTSPGIWELSFFDDNGEMFSLSMGDEDHIIQQLKIIESDKGLDHLMGKQI